jgi:hypothetical protein
VSKAQEEYNKELEKSVADWDYMAQLDSRISAAQHNAEMSSTRFDRAIDQGEKISYEKTTDENGNVVYNKKTTAVTKEDVLSNVRT